MKITIDAHGIDDFERLELVKVYDQVEARLEFKNHLGGPNITRVVGMWPIKKSRSIDGLHAFCPDITLDIINIDEKPPNDTAIIDKLIDKINDGLIIDKDWQREEILCWIRVQRIKAWADHQAKVSND